MDGEHIDSDILEQFYDSVVEEELAIGHEITKKHLSRHGLKIKNSNDFIAS